MTKGAVWLTRDGHQQRLRRATRPLQLNDELSLCYDPVILATQPETPVCVGAGEGWSVWYKPAGMPSSGSRFGDHCAINRWIERHGSTTAQLVHRLDRFTTGLMVIAHSKQAARHLSRQFEQRTINKRYHAVVAATVTEPCTLQQPLDGKAADSRVQPLATAEGLSLLEVTLMTGRKHQIRRHLAMAGWPILGDRQYGDENKQGYKEGIELQLCAVALGFDCPVTGQRQTFSLAAEYLPAFPPETSSG